VNQKTDASSGVRLAAHWRMISWAVLDKGLQLVYGVAFLFLVVGGLPREEYGLQSLAMVVQLTASQLFRALLLVPLIKYIAEAGGPGRVASTGLLLHVAACSTTGLLLWAGRDTWAAIFHKPDLAVVLVPTAVLLAVASGRDAAISTLEGQRHLRTVFALDLTYFVAAILGLVTWRAGFGPRAASTVQWVLAAAAAFGTVVNLTVIRRSLRQRPSAVEARRILRFGAGSFGSGLGATLQQQGDVLLAGRLMDAQGLAAYNAAKMIFRVFNVLAQAINQVLMPTVSKLDAARRRDDLRVLFEKSVCFLSMAIVPLCLLLVLGASPLLHGLFGGRYDDSVPVFQLLVASAMVLPVATIGSAYLTGLGRLRTLVWMTWAGVILMFLLLAVWIPRWGPAGAAAATLVAAVFGAVVRALVLRRELGFHFRGIVLRVHDALAFARRRFSMALRSR
jgi:O-antigen/teichoic acid export membrane protein